MPPADAIERRPILVWSFSATRALHYHHPNSTVQLGDGSLQLIIVLFYNMKTRKCASFFCLNAEGLLVFPHPYILIYENPPNTYRLYYDVTGGMDLEYSSQGGGDYDLLYQLRSVYIRGI